MSRIIPDAAPRGGASPIHVLTPPKPPSPRRRRALAAVAVIALVALTLTGCVDPEKCKQAGGHMDVKRVTVMHKVGSAWVAQTSREDVCVKNGKEIRP